MHTIEEYNGLDRISNRSIMSKHNFGRILHSKATYSLLSLSSRILVPRYLSTRNNMPLAYYSGEISFGFGGDCIGCYDSPSYDYYDDIRRGMDGISYNLSSNHEKGYN